jgi:hypothetical protein
MALSSKKKDKRKGLKSRQAVLSAHTETYDLSAGEEWEEESGEGKTTITLVAIKGQGKTTAGMMYQEGLDELMVVISYDGKAQKNKNKDFRGENIKVFDIRKHYQRDPALIRDSGAKCMDMIMSLLNRYQKDELSWVFHDMMELLPKFAEMKSRQFFGKTATQPCSGYDEVWKRRRAILEDCHEKSLAVAKYGVIYTGKTIRENILVDGEVITSGPRKPNWSGIVEDTTDVTILLDVEEEYLKKGIKHNRIAFIDNSKEDYPVDHHYYDVNGFDNLRAFVKGEGVEIQRTPPEKHKLKHKAEEDDEEEEEGVVTISTPKKKKGFPKGKRGKGKGKKK